MKGILGRKVGMTQVFTEQGQAIAVSVIEVKPNVITEILTKEKHGYDAIQLAVEDRKKSTHKKPEVGHFKKSNTVPKKFVKEIKNFEGDFSLGQTIDASIFAPGELVDVIGISKGKGFAGAIKRHNQSIGPKSHGGGGGSQPQRQTGSLGDIAGNKVVKGMTMPGHMGSERTTMQNLEVIAIDLASNALLVKGSIPGPNKSFVIVRQAVKGLDNKTGVKLVNVREAQEKNALLEAAKKAGADVNTDMSVEDMKAAIKAADEARIASREALEAKKEADKLAEEATKVEAAAEKAQEAVETAKASGDTEAVKEAEVKVEQLEKQVEAVEAKAEEAKVEAQEAKAEAKSAVKEAEKLQVETEPTIVEEKEVKDGGDK